MFKKATFAFAGVLAMVAAATISTTAGAADTDAALVDNVRFYANPGGAGVSDDATADGTCKKVSVEPGGPAFAEGARSAELIVTGVTVKLFSDLTCETELSELNSTNPKDLGLTWPPATAKSYKLVSS